MDVWKGNNFFFSSLVAEKASLWPLCTSHHVVLEGDFMSRDQSHFRINRPFFTLCPTDMMKGM